MQRADSFDLAWEGAKTKVLSTTTASAKLEVDGIVGGLKLTAWDELIGLLFKEAEELALHCLEEMNESESFSLDRLESAEPFQEIEHKASNLLREYEDVLQKSYCLKTQQTAIKRDLNDSEHLEKALRAQIIASIEEKTTFESQLQSITSRLASVLKQKAESDRYSLAYEHQVSLHKDLTELRINTAKAQEYSLTVLQRCRMEQEDLTSTLIERSARTSIARARVRQAVRLN